MSKAFWQAKIEGLLQGSLLKPLQTSESLEANLINQASSIASASDRALFDLIPDPEGAPRSVTVSHLLSGEKLSLGYDWQRIRELRTRIETTLISQSPLKAVTPPEEATVHQLKQQFWWLWRCLPEVIAKTEAVQLLMPETLILPDVSLWSQASPTAAMSGTLVGYQDSAEANGGDRPYLAVFSFTPVQELIKASRKMRDFWAGSWVLHYLSAKICWKLAQQYGPDSLIYPSLFQQPLIDLWLLEKWPEFSDGLSKPHSRKLLTAGFPNVIVMLLP